MSGRRQPEQRSRRGGQLVLLLVLFGLAAVPPAARAGVPLVSRVVVSDVTPRAFTVNWHSSEPATGSLYLFQDDCTTPLANPVLASEQSDRTGFVRVTVTELTAATGYCYQTVTTSKSTSETSVTPAAPARVTTERRVNRVLGSGGTNVPAGNDLLKAPAPYLATPTAGQSGILLQLNLADSPGSRPLSVLLTTDQARNSFNMNNLFSPANNETRNLTGGERVKVTEQYGYLGCVAIERFRKVPADQERTTARIMESSGKGVADIDCNATVNILDVIRVARGVGTSQGDVCFNSDLDLNGDGAVDQLDLQAVMGGLDATP